MNETVFKELLEEALLGEFTAYDNAPEHKFSLRHRLAMKRIFARFERNTRKLKENEIIGELPMSEYKTRLSLKQRMIIVTIIIILMTFLVGWIKVYVSEKFHGTVYHDYTQIIAVDLENCPQFIEYKYALASVPEGFEMVETTSSQTNSYTLYMNNLTKQTIVLQQWVKKHFAPQFNTEYYQLEEVNINGGTGVCIDFSDETYIQTLVVWDNGDYIIKIVANLDKESTVNLAKIYKI